LFNWQTKLMGGKTIPKSLTSYSIENSVIKVKLFFTLANTICEFCELFGSEGDFNFK